MIFRSSTNSTTPFIPTNKSEDIEGVIICVLVSQGLDVVVAFLNFRKVRFYFTPNMLLLKISKLQMLIKVKLSAFLKLLLNVAKENLISDTCDPDRDRSFQLRIDQGFLRNG